MGIDIDHLLVETVTPYGGAKNEYGDKQYSAGTAEAALYRPISTLDQIGNRNEVAIDGILWLAADSTAEKGDIYYHADEGFLKLTRKLVAKTRVTNNRTKFLKFEVEKQRQLS